MQEKYEQILTNLLLSEDFKGFLIVVKTFDIAKENYIDKLDFILNIIKEVSGSKEVPFEAYGSERLLNAFSNEKKELTFFEKVKNLINEIINYFTYELETDNKMIFSDREKEDFDNEMKKVGRNFNIL